MTTIEDLPLMTNQKSIIIQELLSETSPAFLFTSPYKYAIMTYRMIRKTLKEGLSPDSGLALAFGMLTTGIFRTPLKAQIIFDKIKNILRTNKMDSVEPVLLFVECMVVQHWFETYSRVLRTAEEGEKASIKQGNLVYLGWNQYMQIMICGYGGLANTEELLNRVEQAISFSHQYKLLALTEKYYSKLLELKALKGEIAYDKTWDFEDFKEADYLARNKKEGGDVAAIFGWYVSKGNIYALMGDFRQAIDFFKIADESKSSVENTIFHTWLKQLVVMIYAY
jgi:tetratricopeptide (TPR) repeat protein